ncbi:hypothetical protein GWK47_040182 [Chionoecetes opilio]|uniref:Uncharacterized protein n=1 Tax=Chionoecetes opilio TaxID=41210 RepID=A0A8J4YAW2_CHIOP|nr:hypothetical protein GWK47_040182 [Chionoecetes opilio]
MRPVVTSLDTLQIEREAYVGVLLPTLYVLRDSLRALMAKSFKHAQPFLEYLLDNPLNGKRPKGFKARFLSLFDNMVFLMATAIPPVFKLPVVRFINPKKPFRTPGLTDTDGTNFTRLSNKTGKKLESWCSEKKKNKLLEQAMFPALSRTAWMMCLLSTTRPYLALQPWINFSQGSDVMKAQRTSLTSENPKKLVFMKGNMDLLKMKLSPEDFE